MSVGLGGSSPSWDDQYRSNTDSPTNVGCGYKSNTDSPSNVSSESSEVSSRERTPADKMDQAADKSSMQMKTFLTGQADKSNLPKNPDPDAGKHTVKVRTGKAFSFKAEHTAMGRDHWDSIRSKGPQKD